MSRFYEFGFDGRLVNLDHVRSIEVRREEKPDSRGWQGYSIFATYSDDTSETFKSGIEPNIVEATAPTVPANPGFELLSFYFSDDEGYEPAAHDVGKFYNRTPIVAWRITDAGPEPGIMAQPPQAG